MCYFFCCNVFFFLLSQKQKNPKKTPIFLWGGPAPANNGFYQTSGVGTGLLAPADKPGRTPFRVFAMGRRHMFFEGGVPMGQIAPDMAGHPLSLSEDLHDVSSKPDVELLPLQFIGHAVVVIVDIDMVIDVDGSDLPLGVFVGFLYQGQSVGLIEQNKQLAARLLEFAQGSVI